MSLVQQQLHDGYRVCIVEYIQRLKGENQQFISPPKKLPAKNTMSSRWRD